MSEPTREQIKEAFNKTIERWEKIVESIDYFYHSNCTLCRMPPSGGGCEEKGCPISFYHKGGCHESPYYKFRENKTPANALAELNFLRKVYIWWMEREVNKIFDKHGIGLPMEEKKEEWVDVTRQLTWKMEFGGNDFYYIGGYYEGERVVNADVSGLWIPNYPGDKDFKVESQHARQCPSFRILKKA